MIRLLALISFVLIATVVSQEEVYQERVIDDSFKARASAFIQSKYRVIS